jgi:hypothetical protein
MEHDKKADLKRRTFLLSMGAGGASAVAAVAATAGKAAPAVKVAAAAADEARDAGVSEHVRNYYRTARI